MVNDIQRIDLSVNLLKALLWQYNEAARLQFLLEAEAAWYKENHTDFWERWYTDVFNLETCNDFGLTIWAIILRQPLFVLNTESDRPTWGFGSYHVNFERGNFTAGAGDVHRVSSETARILLQLRYFQLISSGTVPETNRMLKQIFAQNYGLAWLNDNHDMTQFYTFTFPLPADLRYIFDNFDVLPRPAGVGSGYVIAINETWGFDEYHENFDNGNFSEL